MDLPIPATGPLLAAMVTPAVLISAAGTLVFSTTSRLARIVDRARVLGRELEELDQSPEAPFAEEKRREIELLPGYTRDFTIYEPLLPSAFAIVGTLVLFYGCIELIRETRLALKAVDGEMEFVLHLRRLRRERQLPGAAPAAALPTSRREA